MTVDSTGITITMKILADENMPYAREAFAALGDVETFVGRTVTAAQVRDAEILLVRSVTSVDQHLLAGSQVRFVGSATIGFDHVDVDYLSQQGIGFARAPGSNATSAAEYVLSALLVLAQRRGFQLADKTVGIIGCGNVGTRLQALLEALGVHCLLNDPPLQARTGRRDLVPLTTVLAQADIVSLHVPLETAGRHPTWHLADAAFFAALRKDAIFINTARGQAMDQAALKAHLLNHPECSAVLDVWADEPRIDPELLARVDIATPHIAGYSFDGKVRGTAMIHQAACAHFQQVPQWQMETRLPPPPLTQLHFGAEVSEDWALSCAVLACYDVRGDDARLRRITQATDPAVYFDRLRKEYPLRREFSTLQLVLPASAASWRSRLQGLGFVCPPVC